jgi:hypothetical protein
VAYFHPAPVQKIESSSEVASVRTEVRPSNRTGVQGVCVDRQFEGVRSSKVDSNPQFEGQFRAATKWV